MKQRLWLQQTWCLLKCYFAYLDQVFFQLPSTFREIVQRQFKGTQISMVHRKAEDLIHVSRSMKAKLLTSAGSQIGHECISRVAAALVTALRVGAEGLTAAIFNGTLVDVCGSTKIHNSVLLHLSDTLNTARREWLETYQRSRVCPR